MMRPVRAADTGGYPKGRIRREDILSAAVAVYG
jgi:hypothetical protein